MQNLLAEIGPGSKMVTDSQALNDRRWRRTAPKNKTSTLIRRLTPTPGCHETRIRFDGNADKRSAYSPADHRGRVSLPLFAVGIAVSAHQTAFLAENDAFRRCQRFRCRRRTHTTHAAKTAEMAETQCSQSKSAANGTSTQLKFAPSFITIDKSRRFRHRHTHPALATGGESYALGRFI